MSERYVITGVQLGMLHVVVRKDAREAIINDIIDKQFIGNSDKKVEKDALFLSKQMESKPSGHVKKRRPTF